MLTLPAVEVNATINGIGTSARQAVRMASTSHLTLATIVAGNKIDGITLKEKDRILVKNQISIQQQISITFTPIVDVINSLSGKYLLISSMVKDYYIWFNTGNSTNPLIRNRLGIQVDITIVDVVSTIIGKINTALQSYSDFARILSGNTLILTNTTTGACALPGGNIMQPISVLAYGSDGKFNGVYDCIGNTLLRSVDFENGMGASGVMIVVEQGDIHADSMWMCTNDSPLDITGTHSLVWVKVSQNEVLKNKADILTHDGNTSVRLPIGTDGTVLTADSTAPTGMKWNANISVSASSGYCATFWDEKTTGTIGGASSCAWATRTFNKLQDSNSGTELTPSLGGVSLLGSIMIIPVGTFKISATIPVFKVDGVKVRLITSTGTVLAYSISQTASNSSNANNFNLIITWCGKFLTETRLEIQQYSLRLQSDGFGIASGIPGAPEIYSVLSIQRI